MNYKERKEKLDEYHRKITRMFNSVTDNDYSELLDYMKEHFNDIPMLIVDDDGLEVVDDFQKELESL